MPQSSGDRDAEFYVETYDDSVPDWPCEISFYRQMAAQAKAAGCSVLEIAGGTGRVAIRLAHEGVNVVGLDLSARMLAMARRAPPGWPGWPCWWTASNGCLSALCSLSSRARSCKSTRATSRSRER